MIADLARVAGPLAAAGLALLLIATRRELRLAGLVAWALGVLGLAVYLAPHGHRPLLAAAAVLGLAVAAGGAWLLRRWPWLLALATLACVPARIPVHVGATRANLLVPLYGVVAAAALLLAWELVRDPPARSVELGPIALPLAAFVLWTGLSLLWSEDLRQGAIALLFFHLPFGLLAIAIARLPWRRDWLVALCGLLVGMAVVFAVIGVVQYQVRDVFWNPKVKVDNAYAPFFRVNSVFWDPSIYGRFLVVAILASLALVLHGVARRVAIAASVAIVVIWVGLLFSFSQSSFVALIVGVLLASFFAWGLRATGLAVGVIAVAAVAAALAVPSIRHHSLNSASGGRSKLVSNGVRIAEHHPLVGVGVGGFKKAYAARTHLRGKEPKAAASHDTPVTVAAETGVPGLLLFAWLLVAALGTAFRRPTRTAAGLARLTSGIVLAAIAVHSLFYNAFFEDPLVWGAFGLAALAASALAAEPATEPEQAAAGRPPAAVAARPADRTPAEAG